MDIIVQIIGIIGCIVGLLAYQFREHKRVVISKAFTDVCFAIQYIMLGEYTGACINFIGIIRNISLAKVKKNSREQIWVTVIFVVIISLTCLFTWTGYLSLLAMTAKICTTISYSIKDTKYLRLLTIPSCIIWCVYDILLGSVGGVVFDAFGLFSILIAYIRLDRKMDKSDSNNKAI